MKGPPSTDNLDPMITERAKRIRPFQVMEILERAREMERKGRDIIHMEIGEPDFPSPPSVKEAAIKAIEKDYTFYTPTLGLPLLREAISRYYEREYGLKVPTERVVITEGSSGAFLLLSLTLLERGRVLGITDPGYPCYRNFGHLAEAGLITIPLSEEDGYEIDPAAFEERGVPDLFIIANPSNPTGKVYRKEGLERIYRAIEGKGLLVVDEVYSGLVYDGGFDTALSIADDIIVVNGFSKTFAMTGWRLGWMVIPEGLIPPVQRMAQNIFISPPTISQHAALKALEAKRDLEEMRRTFKERRDFLLERLERMGFTITCKPEGAFYIYAGIKRWKMDSRVFAERALEEAGVAITPGYDFGSYRASEYVRFSYTQGMERLREGCKKLESWLKRL